MTYPPLIQAMLDREAKLLASEYDKAQKWCDECAER